MPRRHYLIIAFIVGVSFLALWFLLQTPGSLTDALAHPFAAVAGTSEQLNTTLLDASESSGVFRAAGQRLLQPWGLVHLVRYYNAPDTDSPKKR